MHQVITSFAGLRAHEEGSEFIIGETEDADGFLIVQESNHRGLQALRQLGLC